jgi:hypothetical protein
MSMKSPIALLALAATAFAADVTGTWTAQAPGRSGGMTTQTFTFKVEGAKLTGTVAGPAGQLPILDGKVDGESISFRQSLPLPIGAVTVTYTGVVNTGAKGDTIEMKRVPSRGQAVTFTVRKIQ